MNYEEAMEIESLLKELEKYEYPFIKHKVSRIREVLHPIFENERKKEFKKQRNLKWSWNHFDPRKEVANAGSLFGKVINCYKEAQEELEYYQNETQDILHAIELTDLPDKEIFKLMKRLKDVRQQRRKAKDFLELLEPVYKFTVNNKEFVKHLNSLQEQIERTINKQSERVYYPRNLTSLEAAFQEAETQKEEME